MFRKKKPKTSKPMDDTSEEQKTENEKSDFFYNLDEMEEAAKIPAAEEETITVSDADEDEDDEIVEIPEDEELAEADDTEEVTTALQESDDWIADEDKVAIDVFQDSNNVYIKCPLPGVEVDDIDISINNDLITIRAHRENQDDIEGEDYFFRECYWGNISRSVILPIEIEADKVEAAMKNGVLTITLPKVRGQRGIRVAVNSED